MVSTQSRLFVHAIVLFGLAFQYSTPAIASLFNAAASASGSFEDSPSAADGVLVLGIKFDSNTPSSTSTMVQTSTELPSATSPPIKVSEASAQTPSLANLVPAGRWRAGVTDYIGTAFNPTGLSQGNSAWHSGASEISSCFGVPKSANISWSLKKGSMTIPPKLSSPTAPSNNVKITEQPADAEKSSTTTIQSTLTLTLHHTIKGSIRHGNPSSTTPSLHPSSGTNSPVISGITPFTGVSGRIGGYRWFWFLPLTFFFVVAFA